MHLFALVAVLPIALLIAWIVGRYSEQAVDEDIDYALSLAGDRGWVSIGRLVSEGQMPRSRAKAVLRAARARKLLRRRMNGRHYLILAIGPVGHGDDETDTPPVGLA